jgi:hypothetical protein
MASQPLSRRGALVFVGCALAVYVFFWIASIVRSLREGGGVGSILVESLFWFPLLFLFGGMFVHGFREKE